MDEKYAVKLSNSCIFWSIIASLLCPKSCKSISIVYNVSDFTDCALTLNTTCIKTMIIVSNLFIIELSFLYPIHLIIPIVFTCGPSLLCYRSFSCNSLTFLPIGESSTQSVVIFSRIILASFLLLSFR